MRQAADLARIERAVDVQHVGGRHPHRFGQNVAPVGAVARMTTPEVIGHTPPDPVELDAAADHVAVWRGLGLVKRQHLGLQQLALQGHAQTILRAAGAQPHETFAGHEHLARHHRLQPVEVGQPVGVRLVGPGEPQALDTVPKFAIFQQ